jgi:hypothetical protein
MPVYLAKLSADVMMNCAWYLYILILVECNSLLQGIDIALITELGGYFWVVFYYLAQF